MKERTYQNRHTAGGEEMVLFSAGGYAFAISASAVDDIRNLEELHAAPEQGRVVQGLERGSSRYHVLDVAAHYGVASLSARRALVLRNSPIALAVETVDRMTHVGVLYALPHAFTGDERRWYRGLALVEGRVIPVVNPDGFLSNGEVVALKAGDREESKAHGATSA